MFLVHERWSGVEGGMKMDSFIGGFSVDICVVKEEEKERKISINCN